MIGVPVHHRRPPLLSTARNSYYDAVHPSPLPMPGFGCSRCTGDSCGTCGSFSIALLPLVLTLMLLIRLLLLSGLLILLLPLMLLFPSLLLPLLVLLLPLMLLTTGGGTSHNFAVTGEHGLWSWGFNEYRQLGHSESTNQHTPGRVPGFDEMEVLKIDGGYVECTQCPVLVVSFVHTQLHCFGSGIRSESAAFLCSAFATCLPSRAELGTERDTSSCMSIARRKKEEIQKETRWTVQKRQ